VENEEETILTLLNSSAKDEWEHQKKHQGQQNDVLDELMGMIGLEDVKEKFLSIKGKVDTAVRQNIEMREERFGAALLGNPGTGGHLSTSQSYDAVGLTFFRQNYRRSALWKIFSLCRCFAR
jgi:hypothetical protein